MLVTAFTAGSVKDGAHFVDLKAMLFGNMIFKSADLAAGKVNEPSADRTFKMIAAARLGGCIVADILKAGAAVFIYDIFFYQTFIYELLKLSVYSGGTYGNIVMPEMVAKIRHGKML